MDSVEIDIIKIQQEVKNLRISTSRKISGLEEKVGQLKALREATVTPANAEQRHFTGHLDYYKKRIYIGDTVKFRTRGKFDSSQGKVSGYTKVRVIATDHKEREIPRAPHNVELLK